MYELWYMGWAFLFVQEIILEISGTYFESLAFGEILSSMHFNFSQEV